MNVGVVEQGCRPLLFDANVLIDYDAGDRELLALCARHLAPVMIPTPILDEVHTLDEADCTLLGLTPVEPTPELLMAAADRSPGLSFQDQLCFLLCDDNGWICVTNDTRLRSACIQSGIRTVRGLRPLIDLVQCGHVEPRRAVSAVQAMHIENPYHISTAVVQAFCWEIGCDLP